LTGETAVGAVAFNVDPSAAASASATVDVLDGAIGFFEDPLQPAVTNNASARVPSNDRWCIRESSPDCGWA
jgi:hypothetical protein